MKGWPNHGISPKRDIPRQVSSISLIDISRDQGSTLGASDKNITGNYRSWVQEVPTLQYPVWLILQPSSSSICHLSPISGIDPRGLKERNAGEIQMDAGPNKGVTCKCAIILNIAEVEPPVQAQRPSIRVIDSYLGPSGLEKILGLRSMNQRHIILSNGNQIHLQALFSQFFFF